MKRDMRHAARLAALDPRHRRRIFRDVRRLTSFTEDIQHAGLKPGGRTLGWRLIRGGPIARLLGRRSVVLLRRVRFGGAEPLCIENTYLPGELADAVRKAGLAGSLYEFMKGLGREPALSHELMDVRGATREETRLLKMRPGRPIVQIARLAFDRRGRPDEFTRNVLRGDRYLFYFELRR